MYQRPFDHFTLTGKSLDPKRVEQAVKRSAEKTGPPPVTPGKTDAITHALDSVVA